MFSSFRPKNFRAGDLFLICRNVPVFDYLLFLKAFTYFNVTENTKKKKLFYYFLSST